MANIESIVGRLTVEETKQMLAQCIVHLQDTDIIEVLDNELETDMKEELMARFEITADAIDETREV